MALLEFLLKLLQLLSGTRPEVGMPTFCIQYLFIAVLTKEGGGGVEINLDVCGMGERFRMKAVLGVLHRV